MKIVYCILGTYNSGGMERVLANKSNYLVSKGFEITIITTDQKSRTPYFKFDDRINHIDLGVNYTEDLNKGIIARIFSYLKKQNKHRKELAEVLHNIKPDITISMFDNDASFITKINDGSRKILEIHFSRFKRLQYNRSGIFKLIDKYRSKKDVDTVKLFDKFIVLTEEDKGYWGDLDNIDVIPNANSFTSINQSNLANKQVVAIGRFDYQKGFDDLLHVWAIVTKMYPDWRLRIYGHGPLKSKFEKLIISLKIQNHVQLMEPTKDIIDVYQESSILAMTSRYEGLPMVLLEGQVCGLPLVSYSCKCGPKDVITDGYNGFLVEEGAIEDMANKIMFLIEDEELRRKMGYHSFLNSANFSEEQVMKKWIDLFNQTLAV